MVLVTVLYNCNIISIFVSTSSSQCEYSLMNHCLVWVLINYVFSLLSSRILKRKKERSFSLLVCEITLPALRYITSKERFISWFDKSDSGSLIHTPSFILTSCETMLSSLIEQLTFILLVLKPLFELKASLFAYEFRILK